MKSKFNWTPENIETLKQLAADGLSCSLIGEQLGLTKNAVVGKLHRLGIKYREVKVDKRTPKTSMAIYPKTTNSCVVAGNDPLRLRLQRELQDSAQPSAYSDTSLRPPQRTQHSFGTILIHRHNKFKPGSDQLYADLAKAAANTLVLQKKLAREA